MKENTKADLPELDFTDHTDGYFYLSDRNLACLFLPNLDYEAQLDAINSLLWRHEQADKALSDEIKEIEAHARRLSGMQNQHAVDEWVDRMHASVYQNAAHSMAAVGMLAPLVESIFHQAFLGIQTHYGSQSMNLPSHARWQQAEKDEWDCHFFWKNGRRNKDLVEGIFQLADAVGLMPHLPLSVGTGQIWTRPPPEAGPSMSLFRLTHAPVFGPTWLILVRCISMSLFIALGCHVATMLAWLLLKDAI